MARFRDLVFLSTFMLPSSGFPTEPVPLSPMPEALQSKVQDAEALVRSQFQREVGRKPKTSRELLEWLDQKSLASKDLDDKQRDELVQSYGAVLGQVLVHELGGHWVMVPSQENSPGVDLPNGKVAFVFNRAGRRIFEGDPTGFVKFFDAAASYVHGAALPEGGDAKVKR